MPMTSQRLAPEMKPVLVYSGPGRNAANAKALEQLYDRGAIYASLTGSGSSLFGIFEKGKADASGWGPAHEAITIA